MSAGTVRKKIFSWGRSGAPLGVNDALRNYADPVDISACFEDNNIVQISAGSQHCAALTTTGTVYSWGHNHSGQLAHGDVVDRLAPEVVKTVTLWNHTLKRKVVKVCTGELHTLLATSDGQLFAVGDNNDTVLGIGPRSSIVVHPRPVLIPESALQPKNGGVSTPDSQRRNSPPHSGDSFSDSNSNSIHGSETVPVDQNPLGIDIDTLGRHSLAIAGAGGRVFSWGIGSKGQLGHGTYEPSFIPQQILSLENIRIVQVSCGWSHSMCLSEDGRVFTFGDGEDGKLGLGNTLDFVVPFTVNYFINNKIFIKHIAAGHFHSTAIDDSGFLYTWGSGATGLLGHGDQANQLIPKKVSLWKCLKQPSTSKQHASPRLPSNATTANGTNHSTSKNTAAIDSHTPTHENPPRTPTKAARSTAAGTVDHAPNSALHLDISSITTEKGETTGDNGLEGDALQDLISGKGLVFTPPATPSKKTKMDAYSPAISSAYYVRDCTNEWSENDAVVSVACGAFHMIVANHAGACFSWGKGDAFALGHGNSNDILIPTQISSLKNERVTMVACGMNHSIAISEILEIHEDIETQPANTFHQHLENATQDQQPTQQSEHKEQMSPRTAAILSSTTTQPAQKSRRASIIAEPHQELKTRTPTLQSSDGASSQDPTNGDVSPRQTSSRTIVSRPTGRGASPPASTRSNTSPPPSQVVPSSDGSNPPSSSASSFTHGTATNASNSTQSSASQTPTTTAPNSMTVPIPSNTNFLSGVNSNVTMPLSESAKAAAEIRVLGGTATARAFEKAIYGVDHDAPTASSRLQGDGTLNGEGVGTPPNPRSPFAASLTVAECDRLSPEPTSVPVTMTSAPGSSRPMRISPNQRRRANVVVEEDFPNIGRTWVSTVVDTAEYSLASTLVDREVAQLRFMLAASNTTIPPPIQPQLPQLQQVTQPARRGSLRGPNRSSVHPSSPSRPPRRASDAARVRVKTKSEHREKQVFTVCDFSEDSEARAVSSSESEPDNNEEPSDEEGNAAMNPDMRAEATEDVPPVIDDPKEFSRRERERRTNRQQKQDHHQLAHQHQQQAGYHGHQDPDERRRGPRGLASTPPVNSSITSSVSPQTTSTTIPTMDSSLTRKTTAPGQAGYDSPTGSIVSSSISPSRQFSSPALSTPEKSNAPQLQGVARPRPKNTADLRASFASPSETDTGAEDDKIDTMIEEEIERQNALMEAQFDAAIGRPPPAWKHADSSASGDPTDSAASPSSPIKFGFSHRVVDSSELAPHDQRYTKIDSTNAMDLLPNLASPAAKESLYLQLDSVEVPKDREEKKSPRGRDSKAKKKGKKSTGSSHVSGAVNGVNRFSALFENVFKHGNKEDRLDATQHDMDKQSARQESVADYWLTEVIPRWDTMKKSRTTKRLWRKGIPANIRGVVWSFLIRNDLSLDYSVYEAAKRSAKMRFQLWLDGTHDSSKLGQSVFHVIDVDVPRTHPETKLFKPGGPFYGDLIDLLHTYSAFDRDMSYVQGMSYLAAFFVTHCVDPFTAFRCFANLLNTHFFRNLFKMNLTQILRHMCAYDLLFERHMPTLYAHFKKLGVTPEQYLLDWFMTCFSRAFSLRTSSRIFDCLIIEGEIFLYRTALAILKISEKQLLAAEFESLLPMFRNISREMDEETLFSTIKGIKVPREVRDFISKITREAPNH